MPRERHVFPTKEIPHLWFHAPQRDARNPQGNLYFRDDTIYSYRDSWPLARIYRDRKGAPALVLGNSGRYSSTTADHASSVYRAVPDSVPYFEVPHCTRDTWGNTETERDAQNVAFLVKAAAGELAKAQRAQLAANVEWRMQSADAAITNARRYMDYFRMRGRRPVFPAEEWRAALERARRIENPDPASADRRERASAKRRAAAGEVAEYREAMAESMRKAGHWLSYRATRGNRWPATLARLIGAKGETEIETAARRSDWRLFGTFGAGHPRHDGPCMLRVNGEEIETSQGARIPLAAAPMVWAAIERAMRRGQAWKPSGLSGMKVGHYAIDEIGADGSLRAGCHVIQASELRMMARQLNLIGV